jgi:hypothetical protein
VMKNSLTHVRLLKIREMEGTINGDKWRM